ncbi:Peptidyl-prolyl cis-trans isomerase c, partial [Globisporangium splendens]
MLPRNGGRVGRAGDKRLDTRKIILVGMALLFVSYFVVVNMFFSISGSTTTTSTTGNNVIEANTAHEVHESAKTLAAVVKEEETALPKQPEHKWVRNPDRRYVWLDVAIDDVPIGRVTAELYSDLVPKTAENFRALTTGEKGPNYSFKNSVCHRILTGFIVQCGDFTTGKGYGGRSIYGNKFDDEPNGLRLTHSKRYILQMANSGPNTNGSQFCFMLGPAPHLNGHHVVFGEVVDGFEVVDKMEAAGVQADGIPLQHKVQFLDGGEYL